MNNFKPFDFSNVVKFDYILGYLYLSVSVKSQKINTKQNESLDERLKN